MQNPEKQNRNTHLSPAVPSQGRVFYNFKIYKMKCKRKENGDNNRKQKIKCCKRLKFDACPLTLFGYFSILLFVVGYGRIAQLGEHLPYKQGVTGSSPVVPTITKPLNQ